MGSEEDDHLIASSITQPLKFAALFDRHYRAIWRYLCRRVGPTLADDLAGETFLRAFVGRGGYLPGGLGARPWLYGIATNVLRENARREERYVRALTRAAGLEAATGDLEDVEGRVDAAALAPSVAVALSTLAPAERDALLLLALTELDYEGIAIATGVPVGTVRSRLHRARRRVRHELGFELDLEGVGGERS
jgi:RNA polymerase sigma-70 factor (ECF subfamily)